MDFERHLEVDGTFNLRDIGHYATRSGRRTRAGRFYRCGALHDIGQLAPLGVRTVVDLRTDAEIIRDGVACGPIREADGMRRVARSLMPQSVEGKPPSAYLDALVGPGMSAARYAMYLEIAADNIRAVIETLAEPDATPSVVHCTAGKDRTGVVVALVLDVLGVPPETIVDDYDLSNLATPQLVDHVRRVNHAPDFEPSESDLISMGAPREAMQGLLSRMHADHGSARGYLDSIGVDRGVFDALEHSLLED